MNDTIVTLGNNFSTNGTEKCEEKTYGKIENLTELLRNSITKKEMKEYLNIQSKKAEKEKGLYFFGYVPKGQDLDHLTCYCTLANTWPYSPFRSQILYMSHLGYKPILRNELSIQLRKFFTELEKKIRNRKAILTNTYDEKTSLILSKSRFRLIEESIRLNISSKTYRNLDLRNINKKVYIRPFQRTDFDGMRQIEAECFRELYHWSSDAILNMANNRYYLLLVARNQELNKVVGYAWNVWYPQSLTGWLIAIAVQPDKQNQGIGKALLLKSFEWYALKEVTSVSLETPTNTSNTALYFYRSLGFRGTNHKTFTHCLAMST